MNIHCFDQQVRSMPNRVVILGIVFMLLSWITVPLAQGADAFVREVQRIESKDLKALGVLSPVGLSFSPRAGEFIILDRSQTGASDETKLKSINLDQGTVSSSISLPVDITDPINTVFDEKDNRFLGLLADQGQLIEGAANKRGILKRRVFTVTVLPSTLSLQNPQGMTINPQNGVLYILDSGKIARVEFETNSEEFDRATVSEINLPPETGGAGEHRGIAFNPNDGLLYILNPMQHKLYGITTSGTLKSTRDLSALDFSNSGAIVFAASGDSTDDLEQISLYIADRGLEGNDSIQAQGANNNGPQIVELSLTESVRVQRAALVTATATLIQVIDTSMFVNPNPPPAGLASPDPSGITYVPNRDILWINDGEVDEVTGAPSDQFNVFEVDYLSGALVAARTTIDNVPGGADFSNEPVGASAINVVGTNEYMYITDDDLNTSQGGRQIWEVHPGQDGIYGTSDDNPVLARITNHFGSTDPEGIDIGEVAAGQKFLFVVDGVDNEVYKIDLRGNQRLDGSDPVSSFDTNAAGLKDPEGIAFNTDTGTVFAIGRPSQSLFEFDVNGNFLRKFDLPVAASLVHPAGLAFAPSSLNPAEMNLYVADRGIDNSVDSNENDGLVFEFDITPGGSGNQNPVAIDDNVTTPQDTAATGNVLDGTLSGGTPDQDPDGDSIQVTANTTPNNGVLTSGVNANGSFTYTPNMGYTGLDSFDYTISDGNGGTATATVNIVVNSQGTMIIEVSIAASSDDAEERVGGGNRAKITSGDIDFTRSGGSAQVVGLRFLPAIPAGATIQNAYIQFTADETRSGNIALTIRGQDIDDAPTFANVTDNISSRMVTGAAVSWSPGAWIQNDAGLAQRTPNIESIIQEIVNRPGWSSGNGLAVIITSNDPNDLDKRAAESFDAGNATEAAKLHVEYEI